LSWHIHQGLHRWEKAGEFDEVFGLVLSSNTEHSSMVAARARKRPFILDGQAVATGQEGDYSLMASHEWSIQYSTRAGNDGY